MTKIASVFTQTFSSPAGKEVLKHLEKQFKEKTDLLPDSEYKYYAGQRSVLTLIYKLIEKGRENDE